MKRIECFNYNPTFGVAKVSGVADSEVRIVITLLVPIQLRYFFNLPYASSMKIGLISDTHGWLDPAIHHWFDGVEMILHAGDVGNEAVLRELETLAPTLAVRGNVDGGAWTHDAPLERVVEVSGTRIAMLHIAGNPKRPTSAAKELIAREKPDILLVGHSHIVVVERREGVLWINPGAAGRQGWHKERTAAILHLGEERNLDMITLGKRGK